MVLDTFVAAIKRIEGYIPPGPGYPNGSYAYRNNNPGNLVFVGQRGAVLGDGGYARFPSYAAGLQALQAQVLLDASRGFTLRQFVTKYAPPEGNDTEAYIASLSAATGVGENQQLSTALQSGGGDQPLAAAQSDSADSGVVASLAPVTSWLSDTYNSAVAAVDASNSGDGATAPGVGLEIVLGLGLAALAYTIA